MPTAAALSRWETGNNLSAHQEGPGKENITPHPCCAHHAAPGKTGSRGEFAKQWVQREHICSERRKETGRQTE